MSRLFAITPRRDDFARAVLTDIKAGIYDAAVLLAEGSQKPYALLAPMSPEQVSSARSISYGRKQRFYSEGDYDAAIARNPAMFENTRLVVGKSHMGTIATGSLDCCAFFGIHYPSSRVWTESLDTEYKFFLSSGFKKASAKEISPDHEAVQAELRERSAYLRHYKL